MARQRARTAEAKAGSGRAAFDQAAAIEALAWAKGGQQLELLPGRALRLVGVEPAPEDGEPGRVGRRPGSRSTAPAAWREWLVATYGSVIEGLVQTGTAPVASIAAELVQAYQVVHEAVHGRAPLLTGAEIREIVTTAAQMRLTAQRYAAPYQHSQAPQPVDAAPQVRAAIAMFVGAAQASGQVSPQVQQDAASLLAGLLSGNQQNQQVSDAVEVELNATELNARPREGG